MMSIYNDFQDSHTLQLKLRKLLKLSGVRAFNHWRIKNKKQEIDFSNEDFSKRNLAGIDLRGVELHNATFAGANLHGATFDGASMEGVCLREAFCLRASFVGVDGYEIDFTDANCTKADFTRAILEEPDVRRACFTGSNFKSASFRNPQNYEDAIGLLL